MHRIGNMLAVGVVVTLGWNSVRVLGAVEIPFTEHFATDAADWRDAPGTANLTWVPNGGPDGSAYVSGTFNFVNSTTADTPAIFRAHDEYGTSGSSGGAFVGNWVDAGVGGLCFSVRHNAPEPLTFFVRFASPTNFPGAVSVLSPPVAGGVWTRLNVSIPDPNFVFEGPFTFAQVFSNIGHVQIGVFAPAGLVGVDQVVTFDLDNVSIDDTPACAPAISIAGAGLLGACILAVGAGVLHRRLTGAGLVRSSY
jgi:hypothetical protein